ncbi:hypothetical protein [Fibrobacter succinogenes]|uniref:hypothetical protein n=1 Tax=Fibrobacter succinogenes TaxID=833 RepID=UPI0013D192F6|nr:hypothetical protein [Fibrobacter succinogenes]
MNMKKMGLALSLTAAFGLMACGDSSSNANGGMPTCNVTSDANSVTMTSSFQGESYIQKVVIDGDFTIKTTTMKGMPQEDVDEECYITKMDNRGAEVTCSGNTITVKDDADGVTIEYLKKNAESMCKDITSGGFDDADEEVEYPSKYDGQNKEEDVPGVIYSNDPKSVDEDPEGGDSDSVTPSETNPNPNTTVDVMGSYGQSCSIEGEKKNDVIFGMDVPMICKNGMWDADEDAMEQALLCSVEGSTKDTVIAGIAMTLTCDEGEWTMDESSSEEMLKCSQEGATSIVMGLPVVCKDGSWELDEDSVDWGEYGDWDESSVIVD